MQPNLMSFYVFKMINNHKKHKKQTINQRNISNSSRPVLKYEEFNQKSYQHENKKYTRRYITNEELFSNKNTNSYNMKMKNMAIQKYSKYIHKKGLNNILNSSCRNHRLLLQQSKINICSQCQQLKSKQHKLQDIKLVSKIYQDIVDINKKIKMDNQLKKTQSSFEIMNSKQLSYNKRIKSVQVSTITNKNTEKFQYEVKPLKHYNTSKQRKKEQQKLTLSLKKSITIGPTEIAIKKFNHYKLFLNAVQLSYNSYKNIDQISKFQKGLQKYKIFIGPGNNRNLIISLFKRRWWWKIIDNPNQAHFVWTQIKIDTIFKKQSSGNFYTPQNNNEANNITYKPQYLLKMFHEKDKNIRLYNNMNKQIKQLEKIQQPIIVHNHFSKNQMIGNKKALFLNLSKYYKFKNKNLNEFIPLTYHIQSVFTNNFLLFQQKIKQLKGSYWIIKPGQNSNRGTGIFISNSINQIRRKIQKNSSNHTFIVQKYIENLFLFQRRKFDIRAYILLNRINNILKCYWFKDGYIRTSSEIFDLEDLDPIIHLTNDAIQNKGEQYGKYEHGNKVSYSDFQRYLDYNYPKNKYKVSNLIIQMKHISTEVLNSTYFKIDSQKKIHNFQIFGLDFIVDKNFHVWLLEANTNPCLELSSPFLSRLIPNMVQNSLRIALDPIIPPLFECPRLEKYYLSDNFFENNRFELIFDSQFDRDLDYEEFCRQDKQIYEQQKQVFDDDGDEIFLDEENY